jgi:hypothetical protein
MLYEMLTGHVPYAGEHALQVMLQHAHAPPPRLRKGEVYGLTRLPAWNAILARALAKKPERRYATAGALVADLSRLVSSLPPAPSPTVAVTRPAPEPTRLEPSRRPPPPPMRPSVTLSARQRTLLVAAPLILGTMLALPFVLSRVMGNRGTPTATLTVTAAPSMAPSFTAASPAPSPFNQTTTSTALPASRTPTLSPSPSATLATATATRTSTATTGRTPTLTSTATSSLTPRATDTSAPPPPTPPPNNSPTLISPGNQSGRVGQAVSLQIEGADPDGDRLSYSATGLPAGLSIDSLTGLISGTPSQACACQVTVFVDDGQARSNTEFRWDIPGGPPEITPPGDQTGVVGQPVSLQIQASDPDGDPITYGAGGLPEGLVIDLDTGLISGTPTTPCACSVTITASDATGADGETFLWTIVPADVTPTLASPN